MAVFLIGSLVVFLVLSDGNEHKRKDYQLTKLVIISDTHNQHDKLVLPDGDILIHCGDSTGMGTIRETRVFAEWFCKQPFKHKIVIAGNHDFLFQDNRNLAISMFDQDGVHYLEDSGIEIDHMLFWGSPWIPPLFNWAFGKANPSRFVKWDSIPTCTEVLITHGPPYKILDKIETGDEAGDVLLEKRLHALTCSIHCFGHIHESYGTKETNGIKYINAASCNENYNIVNRPIEVDLT